MPVNNKKKKRSRVKTMKKTSTGTRKTENAAKVKKTYKNTKGTAAYTQSVDLRPITKRTYNLETKRKGSTKDYTSKVVKSTVTGKPRTQYYRKRLVTKSH